MSSSSKPQKGHGRPPFTMATHLTASRSETSENDSGFSDASSGYLSAVDLTDSEDTGRTMSTAGQDHTSPQVAMMGGYPGLSPMIVMNNFVLKQPNPVAPAAKQWGFSSPLEMLPQSQVVLLQPMVPNSNSSSVKTGSENHRQTRNYLPILKSYPRIAPYPGKSPSKRQGSSTVRGSSTSVYEQRHRRHHHGHRQYSTPSSLPETQTPIKTTSNFEVANAQTQATDCLEPGVALKQTRPSSVVTEPSSLLSYSPEFPSLLEENGSLDDNYQDVLSMDDNKLKRFSNTYNILNQSGLLGITLRTKELIKENQRTQGQLHQLQEQTSLLMEALSGGDPQLWTKLQLTLQATATAHPEEEEQQSRGMKAQSVLA